MFWLTLRYLVVKEEMSVYYRPMIILPKLSYQVSIFFFVLLICKYDSNSIVIYILKSLKIKSVLVVGGIHLTVFVDVNRTQIYHNKNLIFTWDLNLFSFMFTTIHVLLVTLISYKESISGYLIVKIPFDK
jgi:hypothetical protein